MSRTKFLIKSEEPKQSPVSIPLLRLTNDGIIFFVEELCNKGQQKLVALKEEKKLGWTLTHFPQLRKVG
jgi:hypothetical protein